MRLGRTLTAAVALLASAVSAFGQGAVLQGGSHAPGRVPMYVGNSSGQATVQDSGPASGGQIGLGLAEQLLSVRSSTNSYPVANGGTGQLGTNWCDYDAPINNATGYHYLCMSPNAQGGGLIAYGFGGGASSLPFSFNVNGTSYSFPFVTGGIVGPGTTVVNDVACWNNTTGTLLKDCGAVISTSSNNTWTGTNNFTGPFQVSSVAQTFPGSGNLVGTSDIQTLTNKSINAAEVNSGTLPAAQMPALTGDVTTSAGTVATSIAANAVTNAKINPGAANTVKGSANGTTTTDFAAPSCSAANNALQWVSGTGFQCATVAASIAGFGLNLSGNTMSISSTAPPIGLTDPINMGLSSSAGGSNLTINLTTASGGTPSATNPVLIPFRSTTLATGSLTYAAVTAANSIVIPSGATLGTTNNVPFRIWLFMSLNAGAPELGAIICSAPSATSTLLYPCAAFETMRVTSTTITGLATSAGVLYTPAGVSNDAVRIVGYCDFASGLATAGAWASACTSLQVMGPGVKKPGDVIQENYVSAGTTASSGSPSFPTVTALAAAMTPTSAPNLISAHADVNTAPTGAGTIAVKIYRAASGSFACTTALGQGITTQASANNLSGSSMTTLDSPGSASVLTYGVCWGTSVAAGSINGGMLHIKEIMG